MGSVIPACDKCLGGTDMKKPIADTEAYNSDSADTEAYESDVTTDEEGELMNPQSRNKNTDTLDRDESYFSNSDDESVIDTNRKQKKKELQLAIQQKSKNELEKHQNPYKHYGMDHKTVELLMNVNLGSTPQPTMPSISSVEYSDGSLVTPKVNEDKRLHQSLQSYTETMMFDKEDSYATLTVVDNTDNTPALPNNNKHKLDTSVTSLGGLDYDFERDNALRNDEKNVSDTRIKKTLLLANNSVGAEEIEKLVKKQYNKHDEEEELTDDSSYEEHEKMEIERRKTESISKSERQTSKAKLFRPNTSIPWDETDMDDMHLAMTKEMNAMVNSVNTGVISASYAMVNRDTMESDFETDSEEERDVLNDEMIDMQIKMREMKQDSHGDNDKRTSQLYRHKSAYKWDQDRLEVEQNDMQAQLVNLMMAHRSSVEAENVKQINEQ